MAPPSAGQRLTAVQYTAPFPSVKGKR